MIYIAIILFGTVLSAVIARLTKGSVLGGFLTFLLFLIMFLPSALRYGIGTDYLPVYVRTVVEAQCGAELPMEQSYIWIIELCQWFGSSPQWVLSVYALLTYAIAVASFDDKHIAIGVPAMLLLQYLFTYNGVRQSLAISCLMLAYRFFTEKRFLRLIFMAFCAYVFHHSAFIFLPCLLIACFLSKFSGHKIALIFCIFVFFACCFDFSSIIMKLAGFSVKYESYANSDEYMNCAQMTSGIGVFMRLLATMALFVGLIMGGAKLTASLCGLSVIVMIVGLKLEIFRRFSCITDCVLPFAIAELYVRANERPILKSVGRFCFGLWSVIFLHTICMGYLGGSSSNEAVPYKSIFSSEADIGFD